MILQEKENKTHSGQYLEFVLFVFLKNPQHQNLLSRFTSKGWAESAASLNFTDKRRVDNTTIEKRGSSTLIDKHDRQGSKINNFETT